VRRGDDGGGVSSRVPEGVLKEKKSHRDSRAALPSRVKTTEQTEWLCDVEKWGRSRVYEGGTGLVKLGNVNPGFLDGPDRN